MLINATHAEEVRVAIVEGQRLFDLDIEHRTREQKKANIYKGKITRVEPSLEAAFVDFGAERHGFLSLKEISREYFVKSPRDVQGRLSIREVVREGQELIVQVDKEERGNKGAALSSFISLAGRYLVLMPNNPRAGGISRRIEGEDRNQLKEALNSVTIPSGMGIIVRTAGVGRSSEELQWDLDYLLDLWKTIKSAADERPSPFLIYQESNVIIRAIRDYLRQDIGEVIIDNPQVYDEAHDFMSKVMPQFKNKLKLYQDSVPLFSRYQIENQIETAFQREVKLPSGGSIVIDNTEALVSIDINSARATRGSDIEETALTTNLEAADEIARQLRLRDIGGLIVVDFIDMTPVRNQREVENRMRDALASDRARVQVGRISKFGLMELSRQRLRPSLGETSGVVCPRCNGQGMIRDIESLGLSIIRLIEEEALKDSTGEIHAQLPISVATYLLNEKRDILLGIEKRLDVRIVLIPNPNMDTPHYEVTRVKQNSNQETNETLSYELLSEVAEVEPELVNAETVATKEVPAVTRIQPTTQAPGSKKDAGPGFLKKISSFFNKTLEGQEAAVESSVNETKNKPNPSGAKQSREEQPNRDNQRKDNRGGGKNNNRNRNAKQDRSGNRRPADKKPKRDNRERQQKNPQDAAPRRDRTNNPPPKKKPMKRGDNRSQNKQESSPNTQQRGNKQASPNPAPEQKPYEAAQTSMPFETDKPPASAKPDSPTESNGAPVSKATGNSQAPSNRATTAADQSSTHVAKEATSSPKQQNETAKTEQNTNSNAEKGQASVSTDQTKPTPSANLVEPTDSANTSTPSTEAKPTQAAESAPKRPESSAEPNAKTQSSSADSATAAASTASKTPSSTPSPSTSSEPQTDASSSSDATSGASSETDVANRPQGRASNDPREVRRRQQRQQKESSSEQSPAADVVALPTQESQNVNSSAPPSASGNGDSNPAEENTQNSAAQTSSSETAKQNTSEQAAE